MLIAALGRYRLRTPEGGKSPVRRGDTELAAIGSAQNDSIGVVIPTLGRPTVRRAVASALGQSLQPSRVVVVVDGPLSQMDGLVLPDDARLLVATNRPLQGAAAARNLGVKLAECELIALLDDDDEWKPDKLRIQLEEYRRLRATGIRRPVVGCRSEMVASDGRVIAVSPKEIIRSHQRVGSYLFRRRHVFPHHAALGHSMLLFDTELANHVPFNVHLRRHDDWDWLLRASEFPGVQIRHVPQTLVRYWVHSSASSSRPGWAESVAWARSHAPQLTRHERADFLLCVSAQIALLHDDWDGVRRIIAEVIRLGRSSPQAWIFLGLVSARHGYRRVLGRGKV